jgi:DNA replication and repair protein RecF
MRLKNLHLINFRNYVDRRFDTDSDHVILLGQNGAGKTNFLEAVNYLSLTKSFRTSEDKSLIREGETFFNVTGSVSLSATEHKVEIIYSHNNGKQVFLDGKKSSIRNLLSKVQTVLFHTDDIDVFRGSASQRRRYLDILLSQMDPNYYHHLVVYNHLIRQKREILKKKTVRCSL